MTALGTLDTQRERIEARRWSILFVHPPVAEAVMPNLGIERLAQLVRARGHIARTLYASLSFYPPLPWQVHHAGIAPVVFAPAFYDEADEGWIAQAREHHRGHPDVDTLVAAIEQGMDTARRCIEATLEELRARPVDCVGISMNFDAQRIPGLALARAIRQTFPEVALVAGGTACDGAMGEALQRHFPVFDRVFSGEAEHAFERFLDDIAGSATAPNATNSTSAADSNTTDVLAELNELPLPDYTDFLAQVATSGYGLGHPRIVAHEASRGCWYGLKNHCKFCGIRNVVDPYRIRDSVAVVDELQSLEERYQPEMLYLTDAILSLDFMRAALPLLKERRRTGQMKAVIFAETKSNLKPTEVRDLADAGVLRIQPGIETFLTANLTRVNKGASGIQQVQLLKWCRAFGIHVLYGLMVGIPGEAADDLAELALILPQLHHLTPPVGVNPVLVHRFSPYFAELPVSAYRPFDYQRRLYRLNDDELKTLCYEFELIREDDETGMMQVAQAHIDWTSAAAAGAFRTYSGSEQLGAVRWGDSSTHQQAVFVGLEAAVLKHTQVATSVAALRTRLSSYDGTQVEAAVERLVADGHVMQLDNRILNLCVPLRPRDEIALLAPSFRTIELIAQV